MMIARSRKTPIKKNHIIWQRLMRTMKKVKQNRIKKHRKNQLRKKTITRARNQNGLLRKNQVKIKLPHLLTLMKKRKSTKEMDGEYSLSIS